MEFDSFVEPNPAVAKAKWREYKEAERIAKSQGDKKVASIYKELGAIYGKIKGGRQVIDIQKVIQMGGLKEGLLQPRFAIAGASWGTVHCQYEGNGSVIYFKNHNLNSAGKMNLHKLLPTHNQWWITLEAPVSVIPPKYRPAKLTNDYYILWEVDEWKMVPSTDPYLLKRITRYHFLVLEGWDLTPLEISVMKNYVG